jgi:hypothetical protein
MNEKLESVLKELLASGNADVLASKEGFEAELREKGCSPEEIETVLKSFSGFPLDDDDLAAITGGTPFSRTPLLNPSTRYKF